MSYRRQPKKTQRSASVIVCVLVVILLVGMLSVQTIQTLALIRRGDNERAKIIQARELSELAQAIDWTTTEGQSFTMQIPDKLIRVGEQATQTAIIERQTLAENPHAARIIVRFPADCPGEVTTTVEPDHEQTEDE